MQMYGARRCQMYTRPPSPLRPLTHRLSDTVLHRSLHGCGPSISRQEAGVDVERTEPGDVEQGLRRRAEIYKREPRRRPGSRHSAEEEEEGQGNSGGWDSHHLLTCGSMFP